MGHGHGVCRGIVWGVEMSLEGIKRGAWAQCMQGYGAGC